MKIRRGFVSNSSSSSFIVAFPDKLPTTVVEMQRMLFGNDLVDYPFWDTHEDGEDEIRKEITAEKISERVLRDIEAKTRATEEEMIELISGDCYSYADGPRYTNTKNGDTDWKRFNKEARAWARKRMNAFLGSGAWVFENIFILEYSDNETALESAMEHSDIFRNLPHLRVSHH